MSGWKKANLGELIENYDNQRVPLSSIARAKRQGKYPYYGASGVIDHIDSYIFNGKYLLIAEDGANLITRKTPVAFFASGKFWVNNHAHIVRGKHDVLNTHFLNYWFACSDISNYITGAAQPKLSQKNLNIIEINIPDITQQNTIVEIIKHYDDLIENNQKRIKILEEMAQRLYTEWFVKFKFPGHEKVKMVDSGTEFGVIPEGWELKELGEIAEFTNGFAFKPENLKSEGLPIIKIPELRSGINTNTPRNSGKHIKEKYFIKNGDLLFSWSATLLVKFWNHGDALLNQHLFKIKPSNIDDLGLIYFFIQDLIDKSSNHTVGSTMKHLRKKDVVSFTVIYATPSVRNGFSKIVSNYLSMIQELVKSNETLIQQRDLLIENLITGKRQLKN